MRIAISIALMLLVVLVGVQIYQLYKHNAELQSKVAKADTQIDSLKQDNEKLTADLQYYSNPENLTKEIKGLFNYKKPGEQLFIVVPPKKPE